MLNRFVAGFMSAAMLVSTVSANAALPGFMKIKGQTHGDVKGGATQRGHENQIAVIGASHQIDSPVNAASGLATAKRVHKPFVITKEVDKSSPLLYNMLATNENLSTVTIQFMRGPTASQAAGKEVGGTETPYYTVTLTNARIAAIKFVQPDTEKPETRSLPEIEEVSLTYQKINWTFADGNVQANDDWEAK